MVLKRFSYGKLPAFTLLELMVVIVVMGVGFIFAAPRLAHKASVGDEQTAFFNELIKEHYNEAIRIGSPVKFIGFKGSTGILKYDGVRVSIPGIKSVNSVILNGKRVNGIEYHVAVYPNGMCDYFFLEAQNIYIESKPLLMRTVKR